MKFRDIKHLHEVIDLYHDNLGSLEKIFGYSSYNSKINQVMDDFDLISTEAEFKTFMKKNQNYITTREKDGENHYEEIVEPNINTYLANEAGLFYVGDSAYRIIGEFILSAELDKVNHLLGVKYDNLLKDEIKPNNAKKYTNSEVVDIHYSLKATSTYLGAVLEDDAIRSDGKRRVYLQAKANIQDFIGGKTYDVTIRIWCEKKSWLGAWKKYKSKDLWIYGMDSGYDVIVYSTYWGTLNFEVGNIHAEDFKTYPHKLFYQILYVSGITDPIHFTKVNLKGMTGGSSPAFARIDEVE